MSLYTLMVSLSNHEPCWRLALRQAQDERCTERHAGDWIDRQGPGNARGREIGIGAAASAIIVAPE